MKKAILSLITILFIAVLVPVKSNAQAIFEVPGTIALDVYESDYPNGDNHTVIYKEGRVVLTPSGNLQLKVEFDLSGTDYAGLFDGKVTVYRVAVRVYAKSLGAESVHFEEYNVNGIVDNDVISFVVNWKGSDAMLN